MFVLVQFYTRIYLEEGEIWREIYSNIVIVKLVWTCRLCLRRLKFARGTPPHGEGGGGGELELIFAGYVPVAS